MANSPLILKPNFNRITNSMDIPCNPLNKFMKAEIVDNFSFYQACFGIFDWLQLNNKGKYQIHHMTGSPMLWQPHKSCGWDDLGQLRLGKREAEPCNAKVNASFCYDEMFESCFEIMMKWNGTSPIEYDSKGTQIINEMIRVFSQNATLGAKLTLMMGQYYDPNSPDVIFKDNVSFEDKDAFRKTIGTCKGIMTLARQMGADPKYGHMNVSGIFECEDFENNVYTGDVVALYDNLKDAAPTDLGCLIDEGGIPSAGFGRARTPIMPVSLSVWKAVVRQYQKQCDTVYCLNPRLTKKTKSAAGFTDIDIYYIDNVPVIPLKDGNYYDRYLTGDLHFAFLTIAGNMTLGGSFGAIPEINNRNVALRVTKETSAKELGKMYFMSHALFYSGFADHDYFVGSQLFCVPA